MESKGIYLCTYSEVPNIKLCSASFILWQPGLHSLPRPVKWRLSPLSHMDTALTLPFTYRKFFKKISIGSKNLFQFCKWNLIAKLNCKKRCKDCQNFCKKVMMRKNSSNKKLPQSLKACLIYHWSNFYPSWNKFS